MHLLPLTRIARSVRDGTIEPAAPALSAAAAIGADRLNAFISVAPAAALTRAAEEGPAGNGAGGALALAGVPVAVKDNICTADLPTTCASRILAGYRSPYDATVIRRLRAAGAVIVGKTNLDEFAMGSSTETSAYGPTRNPHDPERVPGGSSGGSAAAVAAGFVPAALGSGTGGSVRQPAAFCGVIGIRPSYGRVSRYGLVAFASSLDQVGVFGRTVADAALLLQIVSGADPLDATASRAPVPDLAAAASSDPEPLVVGVPVEYFEADLDPRVRRACEDALGALRARGATVRELSLPHTRHALAAYYVIAPAEASANLARFDGVHWGMRTPAADADAGDIPGRTRAQGFGAEVKRRILLGACVLSAGFHDEYYATATRVRTLVRDDFERVFAAGVDVLFTPTTPTTAFRIGETTPSEMHTADAFTVAANLAGLPALSLPIGTSDGLPVGGQLLAPRWGEAALVAAAGMLERELHG